LKGRDIPHKDNKAYNQAHAVAIALTVDPRFGPITGFSAFFGAASSVFFGAASSALMLAYRTVCLLFWCTLGALANGTANKEDFKAADKAVAIVRANTST
jgi:hypothetical protein